MNHEPERRLEEAVDRALKNIPELTAPRTLVPRVMAAIQQRAALPWYRQAWQMWPAPLRIASMAVLIASFGGLCFAGWQLTQLEGVAALGREFGRLFAGVTAAVSTLGVLLEAVVLIVKKLGTGFMVGCLLVLAFGYAACVGLGSVCVRLALARR